MVDDIVRFILYAAALLMVGFIVLSGIRWISAGSDTAKAQSAKESLKNGIIGAIIILGVGVIVATIEYVVTTGSLR